MKKYLIQGFVDIHTHTISSGHAYSTITEIAKHAGEIGLSGVAMTDHTPLLQGATHPFHFINLSRMPKDIHGVRILKGAESNILNNDGEVDLDEYVLEELEIVLASLHPQTYDFINNKDATSALLNTMENKNINIIGHPDDARMPYDREAVVRQSKITNTFLEVNCSSLSPNGFRGYTRGLIVETLKECMKQDVAIVVGSDAHYHAAVGKFDYAFDLLEELDFPKELVMNRSLQTTLAALNLES